MFGAIEREQGLTAHICQVLMESDAFTRMRENTDVSQRKSRRTVTAESQVRIPPVHEIKNSVGLVSRPYFGTES